MRTIAIVLVVCLVQAGLAQAPLHPIQERTFPLVKPEGYGFDWYVYCRWHTRTGDEYSVCYLYYQDGKRIRDPYLLADFLGEKFKGIVSVARPRKIQVAEGGTPAESSSAPSNSLLFHPTLSQGRYTYH